VIRRLASAALLAGVLLALAPAGASAFAFTKPAGSPFGPSATGNEGGPAWFDLVDVNGDGIPDAVTLNSLGEGETVGVMLGEGGGRFRAPTEASISPVAPGESLEFPDSAAVGDFNGDGSPDVVAPYNTSSGSGVGLMLGNGDGSFEPAEPTILLPSIGGATTGMAAGDLNGDGNLDLVVAEVPYTEPSKPDALYVLLGNGHGEFAVQPPIVVEPMAGSTSPRAFLEAVSIADVNGDGKPDILVTRDGLAAPHASEVGVSVLLGNGLGGFSEAHGSPFATGGQGAGGGIGVDETEIVTADVNGDGHLDIVTANKQKPRQGTNPSGASVSVLLGSGTGTFAPAPGSPYPDYETGAFSPNPEPNTVAIGDFDGDGHLDLAVANGREKNVAIMRGAGDGSFTYDQGATFALNATTEPSLRVISADLDGDGEPDLAVVEQGPSNRTRLSVLLDALRPVPTPSTRALAFGEVAVGQASAPRTVTITNEGSYPLTVDSIEVDDAAFSVGGGTCSTGAVAVGASCELSVGFAPRAAGPAAATLKIVAGAGVEPLSIALSGSGASAASPPGTGSPPSSPPPPPPTGTGTPAKARLSLRARVLGAGGVAPGGHAKVAVTVANSGAAAGGPVKVCPLKKPAALEAISCLKIGSVPAGGQVTRRLSVRISPRAQSGKKAKLVLGLSSSGAKAVRASVTLEID
jgi:hypothetical protein